LAASVTEIIKFLDTKDETLRSMIGSFVDCNTPARADELIKQIKCREEEYTPDFRAAGKKPFCSIFFAAAYFIRGRRSQALKHLDDAERGFNCNGEEWNLAMARWMHALFAQEMDQSERSKLYFEKAVSILRRLSLEYRRKGHYEDAEECLKLVEQIQASSQPAEPPKSAAPGGPPRQPQEKAPPAPAAPPKTARPVIAGLLFPVYDPVSAGKGGNFIFDSQPQGQAAIHELTIDEKPFRVFSLRTGEPVILHPRVYRWMYVVGDSMNRAQPHPLVEGDCLLVVETGTSGLSPKPDDIVVAALVDPANPTDRAGVVKRYTSTGLRSESSQTYASIPLKKAKVKGIVLAVAKPV